MITAKFVKMVVLAGLIAVGTVGTQATFAQNAEQGNRFGLVAFRNTTDVEVTYYFRWGNGNWERYTLAPGQMRWHSWRYQFVGQNMSPKPQVRYTTDTYGNYTDQQVTAFAAPQQAGAFANVYSFSQYGSFFQLTN
jgi:hypothetical protein